MAIPRGAQILPAGATRSVLAGAGGQRVLVINQYVTVQGSIWSERELTQRLQAQLLRKRVRNGGVLGLT